jgi:glycosyltransferase involved in cell wall biosynthesis
VTRSKAGVQSHLGTGESRGEVAPTVVDLRPEETKELADLSLSPGRRLRVVFVGHVARLSGGEIALLRLIPAMAETIDAHVILGEDGPLVERLRKAGALVEVLPMNNRLRDVRRGQITGRHLPVTQAADFVRYVWQLRRRLKELDADIVHTNTLKAALYGGLAGRLARVPVVWHVRDRISDDYLPKTAVRLVHLASRVLPSAIIANSSATLATLPRAVKGSVLFNPIVHDVVPVYPRSPEVEGRLRVGIVGRLSPWKGQHVFLKAFAETFADRDGEAWIIGSALFGEDAYEKTLHDLVDELGIADRVVWRGFRPDVAAELAQLDILVHASTTPEPFGQVIVEGMAAGLPVIATAAGGPLEIINPGTDGVLVPPGSVKVLSEALSCLADKPLLRQQLGNAARASVRRYSPAAARTRLLAVYQRSLP